MTIQLPSALTIKNPAAKSSISPMFKLKTIEIDGFWQTKTASTAVRDDVNIIIGKNGTGKTTFMNIVHAVLSVDLDALYDNAFRSVTLTLIDGERTRTVRADRRELETTPFATVEYHISTGALLHL